MAAHRYWRLLDTAVITGHMPNTCEYETYEGATEYEPSTVAKGGTAFTYLSQDPVTQAFDDVTNTANDGWITAVGSWISFDYGASNSYDLTKVRAFNSYGAGERAGTFDIQYSDDNTNWTTKWSWDFIAATTGWFESEAPSTFVPNPKIINFL